MLAATLAIITSFLISVTTILMKKAIERTNATSAMLMVTLVGTVIFLILSLPTIPFHYLKSKAFPYFVVAGIFSPAVVRWLYFISLDRIGPSVSSSILATGPAFTAIIALILLNEKITLPIGLGIVIIIGGIIIFERDMHNGAESRNSSSKDLIFPLLSALFFSFAIVTRKMGLNILDSPLFGVTVGFATSLVIYLIVCLVSKKLRASISIKKEDFPYFCAAGISLTAAWLTMFYALSYGDAIVVAPLSNLHPLFVLVLSYFFLGRVEKITRGILVGVCVVVAGVLLVTTGHA
ncbi:MAG: DMT family transporter [Desulfobacterales bacterium]|nr:MAG: DMT family transporter [Desulfobacterales bacterium]